jgi:tetratricopeptide (TPR) repeat protein
MKNFRKKICPAFWWLFLLFVAVVSGVQTNLAYAANQDHCEDVRFAKLPASEYSPEKLQKRLVDNPGDVDALINLGIHLEEQGKDSDAYVLYGKAIQTKPDCSLGYMFAGFVQDKISGQMSMEAEAKINKALSLDPSLQSDPNVKNFQKLHRRYQSSSQSKPDFEQTSISLLSIGSRFLIGVGAGILLMVPVVYLAGRKQRTSAKLV